LDDKYDSGGSGMKNNIIRGLSDRRIFIKCGTQDFRCGVDALAQNAIVMNTDEFLEGSVFAFCSRSKKQIRMVFLDGCGYFMITRKLISGRFTWPDKKEELECCPTMVDTLIILLSDPVSAEAIKAKRIVKAHNYSK
jgi:transposase